MSLMQSPSGTWCRWVSSSLVQPVQLRSATPMQVHNSDGVPACRRARKFARRPCLTLPADGPSWARTTLGAQHIMVLVCHATGQSSMLKKSCRVKSVTCHSVLWRTAGQTLIRHTFCAYQSASACCRVAQSRCGSTTTCRASVMRSRLCVQPTSRLTHCWASCQNARVITASSTSRPRKVVHTVS